MLPHVKFVPSSFLSWHTERFTLGLGAAWRAGVRRARVFGAGSTVKAGLGVLVQSVQASDKN